MNKRLNGIDWLPNFQIGWLACTLQLNLWRPWNLGAGVSPTRQHWILELGPLRFLYERNERPYVESDLQLRRKDPEWLPLLLEAFNDKGRQQILRFKLYNLPSITGYISEVHIQEDLWKGWITIRAATHLATSVRLSFEQLSNVEVVDEQANPS